MKRPPRGAAELFGRSDLAVRLGAVRDLPLPLDRLRRDREQLAEARQPNPLRALVQELLLDVGRELEPAGDCERELRGLCRGRVDLRRGEVDEAREQRQRPVDVRGVGGVVLVVDDLDAAGRERAAFGQLQQPEAGAALDDDVEPAVVEALDHLGDRRERPDLAQAVLVGVDDAERDVVLNALADELAVARLEDMEWHLLRGQEHEAEREQAYLIHACRIERQPIRRRVTTNRVTWPWLCEPFYCGMRASSAWASASRTGSSSIRSSTSWKKPRTISRSASWRERPRAIA